MTRVKRNRPNFGARGISVIKNEIAINHFIPLVRRNEDLYSFVAVRGCVIEKLFIHVSSMKVIESFSLEMLLYQGEDLIRRVYEIKNGSNPFEDGITVLVEGDLVRFDIVDIDSVYVNVGSIAVGILLSNKVSV